MQIEPTTKIWLNFGTKFRLPVNPSTIENDKSSPQDVFNILGFGQVSVPQYPDLETFKFKSFFPGEKEPFVFSQAHSPLFYLDELQRALDSATVGEITIHRPTAGKLHMRCMIKSFKVTDNGGEPNDIYYQLELVEYRKFKPKKLKDITEKEDGKVEAKLQSITREEPVKPVMRVGASVLANGVYCYDSYGSKPHGTANNLKTEVKRIVPGREYPILIGSYGWTKESNLIIKG